MSKVKKYLKYTIWGIIFYIVSSVLINIGLNATYKNIKCGNNIPEQMIIDIAQATSVNGKIYGKVTSTEENDLNGKYIKVQIYTKKGHLAGTKYLQIKDANINEQKKFIVNFKAENIGNYTVDIVEDSEEIRQEIKTFEEMYKEVFTNEELKTYMIITTVLLCMF